MRSDCVTPSVARDELDQVLLEDIAAGLHALRWTTLAAISMSLSLDLGWTPGEEFPVSTLAVSRLIHDAEASGEWPAGWAKAQLDQARDRDAQLSTAHAAEARKSTLTLRQVEAIRSRWMLSNTPGHRIAAVELAAQFGISVKQVRRIGRGLQWRDR